VLYMDTCNEPWAGGYSDPNVSAAERTNYAFREEVNKHNRHTFSCRAARVVSFGHDSHSFVALFLVVPPL